MICAKFLWDSSIGKNMNNKSWRKRTKSKIKYIMGSKCVICGYDRSETALHCHHIFEDDKDFTIAQAISKSKKIEVILEELKKCVLLCANCHAEVHEGLHNNIEFISSYSEIRYNEFVTKCPTCGKVVHQMSHTFCDKSCATKYQLKQSGIKEKIRKSKLIWSEIDVVNLLSRHNGVMVSAAKEVNMSDNGVKKRFIKITGYKTWKDYQYSLPTIVK